MSADPVAAGPFDFPVVTTFGPRLAKRFVRAEDGTITWSNYEDARNFRFGNIRFEGLRGLYGLLCFLQPRHRSAHIRASLRPGFDAERTERLIHRHVEKDVVREPTMIEVPRGYVLFDVDGVPAPDDWHTYLIDFSRDLIESHFPPAFRGVGFVAAATGSAGMKPGARLRLGFILDRPMLGGEIERATQGAPIDVSTLRPVQLVYTAAPIFKNMPDPIAERVTWAWLDREFVTLKVLPEPVRSAPPARRRCPDGERRGLTLDHLVDAVVRAPEGRRRMTLFGCAARSVDLIKASEASYDDVFWALGSAALAAGVPGTRQEIAKHISNGLARGEAGGSP